MLKFSTKLYVKNELTKEVFINKVIEWVSGGSYYHFEMPIIWNKESEFFISSEDFDQTLEINTYEENNTVAVQLKNTHDGILWTNNYVLTDYKGRRVLSVQLYCEAIDISVKFPREFNRPYLLKKIIRDNYGDFDNGIAICDNCTIITSENVQIVADIINGKSHYFLPVVYVTTEFFNEKYSLSPDELAKDLAGSAHVFVESNKEVNNILKELTNFKNPYNGAIQIYYGENISSRIIPNSADTFFNVRKEVTDSLFNRMILTKVDDCLSFNEIHSKMQYKKLKSIDKDSDELAQTYESILKDKESEISSLEANIATANEANQQLQAEITRLRLKLQTYEYYFDKSEKKDTSILIETQENDFFENEIKDTILKILKEKFESMDSDANLKGRRSYHILASILAQNELTNNSEKIFDDIKEVLGNGKDISQKTLRTLKSLGFEIEEGNHYKLKYNNDQRYHFTMAKTTSDYRSMANLISEIKNTLFS